MKITPIPVHAIERTTSEQIALSVVYPRILVERKRRSASSLDETDWHCDFRVALTVAEAVELRSALALAIAQVAE